MPALFLLALGNVIRAQGFSEVAKGAELGRQSLYKAISAAGNPRLKSALDILRVLEFYRGNEFSGWRGGA